MNTNEIKQKKPSNNAFLKLEKRTLGEIKMSGGNDYRLTSLDKSISRKEIKKNILAYSSGDTLYINCFKYKAQQWYSPVLNNGRVLLFLGGISQDENLFNYQIQETETSMFWSKLGGAIGSGIQAAKLAQLRFPYLLDTTNNKIIYLNDFGLEELLSEHNLELLKLYREEKSQNRDSINELILKYVYKLNNL
ncbi:DUF6563 family protein [Croceitalea marina]